MKKRLLEKGELGFAAALCVFGFVCLIASVKIFATAPTLNGEGTVPLITSAVLVLMSLLMLAEMRGCPCGFEKGAAFGMKIRELAAFLFPGKVGLIVIYCLGYAVTLNFLGFVVSTLIFLSGSMITLNRERKVRSVFISSVTLVCIVILFRHIFQVRLP